MNISVHVSGRSYHLAQQAPAALELPEGTGLAAAIAAFVQRLPSGQTLPASCLVIVSGRHLGTLAQHQDIALCDGDELLLLAPVAGG